MPRFTKYGDTRSLIDVSDFGTGADAVASAISALQADRAHPGLFFPPGTWTLDFSGRNPFLLNDKTDATEYRFVGAGRATTLALSGLSSEFAFHCNLTSAGAAFDTGSYSASPVTFESMRIDGSSSPAAGLVDVYNRTVHVRDVVFTGMWRGVRTQGYSDGVEFDGLCRAASPKSSDSWLFEQTNHGDGHRIAVQSYKHPVAKLTKAAGVLVRGVGGRFELSRCPSVRFEDYHLEAAGDGTDHFTTPAVQVDGSHVTFAGGFWQGGETGSSPVVVEVDDTAGWSSHLSFERTVWSDRNTVGGGYVAPTHLHVAALGTDGRVSWSDMVALSWSGSTWSFTYGDPRFTSDVSGITTALSGADLRARGSLHHNGSSWTVS